MALPIEKSNFTYADYIAWEENERIELFDGETVVMAAPSRVHQEISMEISRQIANYLDGKKCKVFAAPFAVRLFEEDNDTPENVQTVFEPDIIVVCDKNKLDNRGCKGAPDMVIEILSPSTARIDRLIKLRQYQLAGVCEYWIVSQDEQTVQVYLLKNGLFHPYEIYEKTDIAKVNVLDGCFIELSKVFPPAETGK